MCPWIEEFARAVESNAVDLSSMQRRDETASKIQAVLTGAGKVKDPTAEQDKAIYRLLDACRVFMRDRRGIDMLLTAESLESFLYLAENQSLSTSAREEALKCIINSVYSRPEFVSETLIAKGFVTRLMVLATHSGTASLHWLVWKVLLVSCDAPEVPRHLSRSLDAWQLIYATLFYSFKHGNQNEIIAGNRATLLLDLVKLITVLVNDMQWTAEQEKLLPDVFHTIHQLGGLLLEILCFRHSGVSPLNDNLIELKNKIMEVLMFLPGSLLAAFIQQQHGVKQENDDDKTGSLLASVLDHLDAMLLVVRVEKMRPLKEMLPTLIVCHNLANTGDRNILNCFKKAILPTSQHTQVTNDRTQAFYFKHLKFFLTCLDTDVRRYTSEWLFLLCDENAKEYTHHTGVGNAIGLLRMKGLA